MTIHRVVWDVADSPFPRWHDFQYAVAAEDFADILRELGHQHVTTHQLDATEQREKP